jgi:hypothetical protein
MRTPIDLLRGLATRDACPVPAACPASLQRRRLLRLSMPLVGFVVPTVVIAYGFVIPRSCIHGLNGLSFGFATTVLGACMTYVFGIRAALKE